jgi:hypothetical protein
MKEYELCIVYQGKKVFYMLRCGTAISLSSAVNFYVEFQDAAMAKTHGILDFFKTKDTYEFSFLHTVKPEHLELNNAIATQIKRFYQIPLK